MRPTASRLLSLLASVLLTVLLAGPVAAAPAVVSEDVIVTSSLDGARLEVRYLRPAEGDDLPVVLFPHGGGGTVESETARAHAYAEAGFVGVTWSARGHGGSEGLYDLFGPLTIQDTKDVLDWVLANRDRTHAGDLVGSMGYSQGGGTTNLLAAFDDRVDAIAPGMTFSGLYESLFHNDCLKLTTDATIMTAAYYAQQARLDPRISGLWAAAALSGVGMDQVREEMEVRSPRVYADRIDQPTLFVQMFDDPLFPADHGVLMDELLSHPSNRLWLSWGGHFSTNDVSSELPSRDAALLDWMRWWLQGDEAAAPTGPRVTWWALSAERDGYVRRDSPTWPPPGTQDVPVAVPTGTLVNAGGAQGLPDDPIAAWGLGMAGIGDVLTGLPNQTPAETLVTSTEAFDEPVVFAGAPRADIRMTSTAVTSQVNVKVWDVAPDGTRVLLSRGCSMAPGEAGGTRQVGFDLWPSAAEIPAGHRLEVWVQPADATTFRPAEQPAVVTLEEGSIVTLPLLRERAGGPGNAPPPEALLGPTPIVLPAAEPQGLASPLPATGGGAAGLGMLLAVVAVARRGVRRD